MPAIVDIDPIQDLIVLLLVAIPTVVLVVFVERSLARVCVSTKLKLTEIP